MSKQEQIEALRRKAVWCRGLPAFPFVAFCMRTGQVEYDVICPRGGLPIMYGKTEADLKAALEPLLRHPYPDDPDQRSIVPGIPEVNDDETAYEALTKFMDWIGSRTLPPEVRLFRRGVGSTPEQQMADNVTKATIWKHLFYALVLFSGFLACECALAMAIALAASNAAEANYQAKSAVMFALFGVVALATAWVRIKR